MLFDAAHLLAALPLATVGEPAMGTGAWTFLVLAWLAVISLAVFCFRRVLRGGRDAGSGTGP